MICVGDLLLAASLADRETSGSEDQFMKRPIQLSRIFQRPCIGLRRVND